MSSFLSFIFFENRFVYRCFFKSKHEENIQWNSNTTSFFFCNTIWFDIHNVLFKCAAGKFSSNLSKHPLLAYYCLSSPSIWLDKHNVLLMHVPQTSNQPSAPYYCLTSPFSLQPASECPLLRNRTNSLSCNVFLFSIPFLFFDKICLKSRKGRIYIITCKHPLWLLNL